MSTANTQEALKEAPLPLHLFLKVPVSTALRVGTSADELLISEIRENLTLDLNSNCNALVGILCGGPEGKLYSNTQLTVQEYLGGNHLRFNLNENSKTELVGIALPNRDLTPNIKIKSYGKSKFKLKNIPLRDVDLELNGHSQIALLPSNNTVGEVCAKIYSNSVLSLEATPRTADLELNSSSVVTISGLQIDSVTKKLKLKTYSSSQLYFGNVENVDINANSSSQIEIGTLQSTHLLEDCRTLWRWPGCATE